MWEIREINNNNEIVQLSKLLENLKSQILSKNIDQNQQWDLNNIKDAINDLEKNITPQNVLSELKDKIKTPEISQEIAKIERVIQQKENTEKNQEVDLVQKDLTKLRKKIHLDTEIENMNESEITKLANQGRKTEAQDVQNMTDELETSTNPILAWFAKKANKKT